MVELFLIVAFVVSYAFDCQAILVRTHRSGDNQAEFQALAGLVQYLSRICVVAAVFAMSAATEALPTPPSYPLVFGVSSGVAIVFYLLTMRSEQFHWLIRRVTRVLVMFSFSRIADYSYWQPLKVGRPTKITVASFVTNTVLLIAAFLPFFIASSFPQYRMTSVYAGQLLNFFATAIMLAVQDPHAMRLLDMGGASSVRSALVQGRIASHFVSLAAIVMVSCL